MSLTGESAAAPIAAQPLLEAEDVSVELGGLPVLRGVGLSLRAGEAVALLGGNGSGKSTLVRALLGLTPIQRGNVRLFGTDVRRFRDWSRIGYVPQRSGLGMAGATVGEVVASGRLGHRKPFVPARRSDKAAVARALAAVDLTDRARLELAHLSGGQQQRAMIARALAGEPDLLVLDEPTSGVDLEHQRTLAGLLGGLLRDGLGILVVLHEIGPLGPLVERAIVLREGRVVHDGRLPEALTEAHGADHGRHVHGGHEHEPPSERRILDGALDVQATRARRGGTERDRT